MKPGSLVLSVLMFLAACGKGHESATTTGTTTNTATSECDQQEMANCLQQCANPEAYCVCRCVNGNVERVDHAKPVDTLDSDAAVGNDPKYHPSLSCKPICGPAATSLSPSSSRGSGGVSGSGGSGGG